MISFTLKSLYTRLKLEYIELTKYITHDYYCVKYKDFKLHIKDNKNELLDMLSNLDNDMNKNLGLLYHSIYFENNNILKLTVTDQGKYNYKLASIENSSD